MEFVGVENRWKEVVLGRYLLDVGGYGGMSVHHRGVLACELGGVVAAAGQGKEHQEGEASSRTGRHVGLRGPKAMAEPFPRYY